MECTSVLSADSVGGLINESALKTGLSFVLIKDCHRVTEARSISKMSINPPQADALCLGASVAFMFKV